MLWRLLTVSSLVVVLCTRGSIAVADPVSPWVHVQGTHFVDAADAPVVLRGLSAKPGLVSPQVSAMGANFVRVECLWNQIETAPGVFSSTVLSKIDAQVAAYQAQGLNVLIDFHQAGLSPYFGGASGVPSWYYADGRFNAKTGKGAAFAAWWTTESAQSLAAYIPFVQLMVARYSQYPSVMGYELFNEPQPGALGDTAAATQDVLDWQAQVRDAAVTVDPSRAMVVMARAGGLLGLRDADFSVFGDLSGLALDIHSYSTGLNGNDLSADGQSWAPSYDATHNQSSTAYHGSADAQQQVLQTGIDKANALGIPLLVGEWGALNSDSGLATYQAQMLDLFARDGLSWARWQLQDNTFALINADGSLDAAGRQIARTLLSTPGADHLAFGQEPTAPAAGAAIDPPVTVLVRGAGGNLVSDAAVPVTLSTSGGGASMTVTSVGGVATFTGFTPTGAGPEQLQATTPGLIAATSSAFTVTAFGADVGVSATAAPASLEADGLVAVTATVTNAGPDAALAAGVSETVPANTVVVAAGASQGSCLLGTQVVCSLGSLPPGGTATVTVLLQPLQPGAGSSVVSASTTSPDALPANNSAGVGWTVTAAQGVSYVTLSGGTFSPTPLTVAEGTTVQWNVTAGIPATVGDNSGLGLFTSAPIPTPVGDFRYRYTGAGQFGVKAGSATTQVMVPLQAPATATRNHSFTVTWAAAAPPTGVVEDVQLAKPGGAFANWKTAQSGLSATYSATAKGKYQFRARMRRTANGKVGGWSPVTAVAVS